MDLDRSMKRMQQYEGLDLKGSTQEELKAIKEQIEYDIQHENDRIAVAEKDHEMVVKLNEIMLTKENYRKVNPTFKFEELDEYWELQLQKAKEKFADEKLMSKNIIAGLNQAKQYYEKKLVEVNELIR
jgi:hypothetical protein